MPLHHASHCPRPGRFLLADEQDPQDYAQWWMTPLSDQANPLVASWLDAGASVLACLGSGNQVRQPPLHCKSEADIVQVRQDACTSGRPTSSFVRGTIWISGRSSEATTKGLRKKKKGLRIHKRRL